MSKNVPKKENPVIICSSDDENCTVSFVDLPEELELNAKSSALALVK